MSITNEQLLNHLKELEIIDKPNLEAAYEQAQNQKLNLLDVLVKKDLLTDETAGKVLADLSKQKFVSLAGEKIPDDVLKIVPEVVAKKQKILAFKKDEHGLHLAMVNPNDLQLIEFVAKKTGLTVIPYQVTEKDFNEALSLFRQEMQLTFAELIKQNIQKTHSSQTDPEPPIIKIVDLIIIYANENKASDIHLEPLDEKSLVRFRIDGVLHDVVELPLNLHDQVVTRIKVMAALRTDEHQTSQDGKIEFKAKELGKEQELDIRVSVVPITNGEKVVMRLLSQTNRQFSLTDLGFLEKELSLLEKTYQKPYGMILSTGPTGSGKTTTMYAVLKILNKRGVNIMTIEDPVEYDIEGINQIQVNTTTDLTFANGLKSIVRQDPDIILVGEIRDEETANIAINAAMTGHLVLSTLHTNDASTTIPRLADMGVEPYLLASTINVVIGQRLVRKICSKCRYSLELDAKDTELSLAEKELVKKYFPSKKGGRIYKGRGCPVCHQTGYRGRIGLFEVMYINDAIKQAIMAKKNASEIADLAIKEGMRTMLQDGIAKAQQGVTTLEEIIRVTKT